LTLARRFLRAFEEVIMRVHSLSAVVFVSAQPERLAAFYNRHLGLGFERRAHGPIASHHEARIGDMRFAIVPGSSATPGPASGVCPTFLVNGVDGFVADLAAAGIAEREPIRPLGEGKRLASFRDPEGNGFQLIDLGFAV
jgi:predicted enzyme related to lactoylglutathione lyase